MGNVRMERIYNEETSPGIRILVDRVWPRGVSKEKAQLDHWLKEIGPTTSLRQWFNHDPQKYETFKEKYEQELQENEAQHETLNQLKRIVKNAKQDVILLYATKDTTYNHVNILKTLI